jgi:DNA-binding response OmpR family regulator
MIIRYLIRTYPNPTSAQKILKHAYKASKQPDVSNIRTHISVINKKFRTVAGRSLIEMHENLGYRILTPELMATAK